MTEIMTSARWAALIVALSVVAWGYSRCERAAEIDQLDKITPLAQTAIVASDNPTTTVSSNAASNDKEAPSVDQAVDQISETLERISPAIQPEDHVVKHGVAFTEIAEAYTNGSSPGDCDFASDLQQMKSEFDALSSIATKFPELTLAHEMLGEVAFVFASILDQHAGSKLSMAGETKAHTVSSDFLRAYSWKAFRTAAQQGSQKAFTYDRLARLKVFITGGNLEDMDMAECLLASMQLDPESGASVQFLFFALTNSRLMDYAGIEFKLASVLPLQRSKARSELVRALNELETEWENGQDYAERAAILGHIDVESQNAMMRNAKLMGILRASLGISPSEPRNLWPKRQ